MGIFVSHRRGELFVLAAIAAGAFAIAFIMRRHNDESIVAAPVMQTALRNAPDSVRLSAMGITPGRQVLAFVLVSSRCGYCQKLETKRAIRSIRGLLAESSEREGYRSSTVVGVAVDADLHEGLQYITNIGFPSFDEISVGGAWLNEQLVRFVWRERTADAAVPQVVIVSRELTATPLPLRVRYGADSVIAVLGGNNALLAWVRSGATVSGAARAASASAQRGDTIAQSTVPISQ